MTSHTSVISFNNCQLAGMGDTDEGYTLTLDAAWLSHMNGRRGMIGVPLLQLSMLVNEGEA